MDYSDVMKELEAAGKAESLDVMRAQGAQGTAWGVPPAEIRRLADAIGRDDELARRLWDSEVVDARILATRVVGPQDLAVDELDGWARDVSYYGLVDHLTDLALRSPHALELIDRWIHADEEFVQRCGFVAMAKLAKSDRPVDESELQSRLEAIESQVQSSTHRAKKELGAALLTIGQRNDRLNALVLEVARKIGRIEIEHPELGRVESDAVELLRNPELAEKLVEE